MRSGRTSGGSWSTRCCVGPYMIRAVITWTIAKISAKLASQDLAASGLEKPATLIE